MKRIAILLTALLLLTACGKTSAPPVLTNDTLPSGASPTQRPTLETLNVDQYDDYLLYPVSDARFGVGENGNLYAAELSYDEDMRSIINSIRVFDLNGNEKEKYVLSEEFDLHNIYSNLWVSDGEIYFIGDGSTAGVWVLYGFDLNTQELEPLAELEEYVGIDPHDPNVKPEIAYADGSVYIFAAHPDYTDAEYEIWEGNTLETYIYRYYGTVLARYDIVQGVFEIVFDKILHDFTLMPNGNILLFAHDSEGGYYFQELDTATGFSLGEKKYRFTNQLDDFAYDGSGFLFVEEKELTYWNDKDNTSAIITKYNGSSRSDRIVQFNKFTFVYHNGGNNEPSRLERYKNSAYIKDNPAVKIISPGAGIVSRLFPDGYYSEGYNVSYNELSYDEFALTVLSRDKMYDVCLLNANDDFSANIKNKGSFYPLNDVPGVQEYIDACFSYIQEAATDVNGKIWIIPICIDVPGILYIGENCQEAGIDFLSATSVYEVMDTVRKAANADPENQHYRFDTSNLIRVALIQYLRDNTMLDTPEFRQLATELKAFWDERQHWGNPGLPEMKEFWFDYIFNPSQSSLLDSNSIISIAPLLGTDGNPNPVKFFAFVCVNPDTNNLDATLEYISNMSRYMLTRPDSMMLKDFYTAFPDTEYVRQLYAMYENAAIRFNISDEIVADDFDRYLAGEIPLDTLITEADRKLRMYLNE